MDALNTRNMFYDKNVHKNVEKWVRRVRGRVIDEKRKPIYRTIPVKWDVHPMDPVAHNEIIETETVLVIEVPLREVESMLKVEDWYERNIGGYSMDRFDRWHRETAKEESLREKHPGLQELWEKYQTMLKLCDDNTFNP